MFPSDTSEKLSVWELYVLTRGEGKTTIRVTYTHTLWQTKHDSRLAERPSLQRAQERGFCKAVAARSRNPRLRGRGPKKGGRDLEAAVAGAAVTVQGIRQADQAQVSKASQCQSQGRCVLHITFPSDNYCK